MQQHWPEIIGGEMIVLLEDECHLLWGDVCGHVWGPRGHAIEVEMTNQKQRQTYYGAVNFLSRQLHLKPFPAGNSQHTIAYLEWLRELYPGKKLLVLGDGASYHRDAQLQAFLAPVNAGLTAQDWWITLMPFAPHAPEQNPVEEVWLAGKNHLRRRFALNKTFTQVKNSFCDFLQTLRLDSVKFAWYAPYPQLI